MRLIIISFLLSLSAALSAQMESMDMGKPKSMDNMDMNAMQMTSNYSINLPMGRDGSGTSWVPDTSPLYAYMLHTKHNWNLMFHGSVFVGFDKQDIFNGGSRGGQRFTAPNWLMGMAQKQLGKKDLLSFTMMLSLEAATEGGEGYPLLFQTGETWQGKPIVDHQHPHDLFSALSVAYTHAFTSDVDLTAYFGYPGEPALGPPAFMHRLSAMNDPDAPLGHHWQDATHITFGVGTLGLRWKWFKAEGSVFTGREPDENRYNFDKPLFDSYSYRLSFNPVKELALQFSQGFLHNPEPAEPAVNVTRYTASIIHTHIFSRKKEAWISSTLVWGMNKDNPGFRQNSILAESNFQWNRFALYARYEWVQKNTTELALLQYYPNEIFNINAITIGSCVRILELFHTDLKLGLQFTFNLPDTRLQSVYIPQINDTFTLYGTLPIGMEVYLHFTPAMVVKKAMPMEM